MTDPAAVHRFTHQAMGTFFEVIVSGGEKAYAGQAAHAAFREIDRLEQLFSRFDGRSEISGINRLKPGEKLPIGVEVFECLTIAEQVREETGGAFDINRRAWENRPKAPEGPEKDDRQEFLPAAFEVTESPTGFLFQRQKGPDPLPLALDIDLGGIGKGYALDAALEVLAEWDIENVLIHGGTSTALGTGSAPDAGEGQEGWPVGVGGGWPCLGIPREVHLVERALSGSGTDVKGAHIINPYDGKPARGHVAAWASHPTAAVADALSTAFMVLSTVELEDFCARYPDVWALAVIGYGQCRVFNPDAL